MFKVPNNQCHSKQKSHFQWKKKKKTNTNYNYTIYTIIACEILMVTTIPFCWNCDNGHGFISSLTNLQCPAQVESIGRNRCNRIELRCIDSSRSLASLDRSVDAIDIIIFVIEQIVPLTWFKTKKLEISLCCNKISIKSKLKKWTYRHSHNTNTYNI